jgi:hypothetical protein
LATVIVHWPGKDGAACDACAAKLRTLAGILGFSVSSTPCVVPLACQSCENEEKNR